MSVDVDVKVLPTDTVEKYFCVACSSEHPQPKLIRPPCGSLYCHLCFENLFKIALRDEASWPPNCCGYKIPSHLARKNLPPAMLRQYKARKLELDTRNKTYCHVPNCSTFIAPHSIHNGHAICQRCSSITCSKCKTSWHYGPCSVEINAAFFEWVRDTKWKRCPKCRRMVEKNGGCNHIV